MTSQAHIHGCRVGTRTQVVSTVLAKTFPTSQRMKGARSTPSALISGLVPAQTEAGGRPGHGTALCPQERPGAWGSQPEPHYEGSRNSERGQTAAPEGAIWGRLSQGNSGDLWLRAGSGFGSKGNKLPNAAVWPFIDVLGVNALLLVCIFIMCPLVINGDITPTEKTKRPQKYLHSRIIKTKSWVTQGSYWFSWERKKWDILTSHAALRHPVNLHHIEPPAVPLEHPLTSAENRPSMKRPHTAPPQQTQPRSSKGGCPTCAAWLQLVERRGPGQEHKAPDPRTPSTLTPPQGMLEHSSWGAPSIQKALWMTSSKAPWECSHQLWGRSLKEPLGQVWWQRISSIFSRGNVTARPITCPAPHSLLLPQSRM